MKIVGNSEKLGQQLETIRKHRGLSLEYMAKCIRKLSKDSKFTGTALRRIENNTAKSLPKPEDLVALCRVYNIETITFLALVGYIGEKENLVSKFLDLRRNIAREKEFSRITKKLLDESIKELHETYKENSMLKLQLNTLKKQKLKVSSGIPGEIKNASVQL
jgi:transcriptional regulator with XRE-family HTH domain